MKYAQEINAMAMNAINNMLNNMLHNPLSPVVIEEFTIIFIFLMSDSTGLKF